MSQNPTEFVRTLGVLRLSVQRLQIAMRENRLDEVEQEASNVQETLLGLIKTQRKLPRQSQSLLRPHFTAIRKEALKALELSRRILDDSLQAMLTLIKCVEEANNYGSQSRGGSMIIDRQA